MLDLLALAFQADVTRICTFMFANEASNRTYPFLGRPRRPPRPLAPRQRPGEAREDQRRSTASTSSSSPTCSSKLKSIKEGDGTLLDHCMIVYGSGISDGNRHNHDDLPILLAGKGGGTIETGRHHQVQPDAAEQPLPVDARPDGHQDRRHGDSTGRLGMLELCRLIPPARSPHEGQRIAVLDHARRIR